MKKMLLLSLLTAALAFTGCSSSSKSKSDGSIGNENIASVNDGEGLEISGSSDDSKAGPLKSVYFPFNSSQITEDTKEALNNNAEFLKGNSSVEVQIEGHCDERGGVQYNLALGERRANAVKNYLVALGVESTRITTISFGKERPVSFGHSEEAWGQNRRGNFVVTNK
jgi:peptidoglycan-associated lipoprotein